MSATVVDIRNIDINSISKNEIFAIDTNVLVWTHYSKASSPYLRAKSYQTIEYPNFVAKLLQNGNQIVTTVLNLTELCGVVEKNQYKIYNLLNGSQIKFKDYRNIASERNQYKQELDVMLAEIKNSYHDQIEVVSVSEKEIQRFQNDIPNMKCDVFDYTIVNFLKEKGITKIISDDKDFVSVDGIELYTTYEV